MDFVTDPGRWDSLVKDHPAGHFLQSYPWGELKAAFGWPAPVRLTWNDPPWGGAQVLFRRLPLGFSVAYVPRGPWWNWSLPEVESALTEIRSLARRRRALVLILEPEAKDDPALTRRLRFLGLSPTRSIQPRSSILIPLDADEDEILARMHSKTRYNVRLSARKGVEVRVGGEEDLPAFYALMQETARRDRFPIHSFEYYREAQRLLVSAGYARLFLAYYQDEMIAGLMAVAFARKGIYLYGASSARHRQRMPNHALQWAAMKWAKEQGCKVYDLWGIPDDVGANPERYDKIGDYGKGGLWGVYRFKQGFGGEVVRTIGAWEMDAFPGGRAIYHLLLKARK